MNQQPVQRAIPQLDLSLLRASVEQIATLLVSAAGAHACYLALPGTPGYRPQMLVAGGDTSLADENPKEITLLLRRMRGRVQPAHVLAHGLPALAVPLNGGRRPLGVLMLIYADAAAIDEPRAVAVAAIAAHAIDATRQITELHVQAEEIEERVRIREIQNSRNLIRGVIDGIPLGLTLLDADGTVLAINRALSQRFGRDPAALVGRSYDEVIGAWEQSSAAQTFASGVAGRVRRTTSRADGTQALLEISSFPLRDVDERPRQVVEVWEDITERVALQTQLIRAEKLAAIGQLAASIAHEVGNPLQAIQGFLALFLEECAPETPNRNYLELAGEEIQRIGQVIARLRDLYRSRADSVESVNVNTLIEHVLLLTGKQLERARITPSCELDPALPPVRAVADQLKQVLLNLVLNAIDAMPGGGLLHMQTFRSRTSADRQITITVTDTGLGIPPEQLPHIFDGLHTTKERGMGLGLYTSKAIIERHMGRISVQSVVGQGTTFTMTLPAESEEV